MPPRRRVRPALLAALCLALAAAACSSSPDAHGKEKPPPTTGHRHVAATFPGPDGMESSAVIAENHLPGTKAWKIFGTPPGFIEGFAGANYARAGQRVRLYVSTDASSFRVEAFRMGWYGGDGAHLVWSSSAVKGKVQPTCPTEAATNTVICDNWSPSLTVPVTRSWFSGDYLLKLVGNKGQEGYVMLTVWAPDSHATYLVVARSLTEEGWNTFGGYDFYQGTGPCLPGTSSYPPCNRAFVVSFDRPYSSGYGSSDFLSNEFPLIEFMEEHGLDVTYTTDVAIDEHPGTVLHHRVVLSLCHDETWTAPELFAVQKAVAEGENVIFFGAAAIVRHARLQSSPMGPDTEEADYRDSALDPLNGKASSWDVTGNTWSDPPTNWSSTSLVGGLYSGYTDPGVQPVPFVVFDPVPWVFKGTGLTKGSKIPEVVDSDIDHVAESLPTPADIQVLGHSPVPLSIAYTNQGEWGGDTYSDMTYYTNPKSKAGVIDTGTTNWICALSLCAGNPTTKADLKQITGNILRLFGEGPAGDSEPSAHNTASVTPAGS